MANLKFIHVQEGQSLMDIAMQLTGSVEGIVSLLEVNPGLNLEDDLFAGQKLYYQPTVLDDQVNKEYGRRNYGPATAGAMSAAEPPSITDNGGFVQILDQNGDEVAIVEPGGTYNVFVLDQVNDEEPYEEYEIDDNG